MPFIASQQTNPFTSSIFLLLGCAAEDSTSIHRDTNINIENKGGQYSLSSGCQVIHHFGVRSEMPGEARFRSST